MSKYRGKYKKCRTCKHVEWVGMELVFIFPGCKHEPKYGSQKNTVFKEDCEICEHWEGKEEGE